MTILTWPIDPTLVEQRGNPEARVTAQNASNMCVGRRLRTKRNSSGISEREFCEKLGIDRHELEAYQQGVKRVSANLLLRIAKLLNVRPDYFFQGYTPEELSACLESSRLRSLLHN